MWYKIKFPPFDDNSLMKNYLCYQPDKGFYLGSRSQARFFQKEHIEHDKKLIDYLKGKEYELEECKGNHTFMIYRGNTY